MKSAKELEEYLNRINELMWETYMIKRIEFGRSEGEKIMRILEDWASDPGARIADAIVD
jgi:hypothetical protein